MPGWSIGTDEGGQALVLGHVRVGAGQHEAPVGDVGVAGPHLVAADDALVAVALGPGAQRRQVGPGVGLAEALAPAVAAVDDAGQEPAPDVVVAVLEDALHQVAEARPGRGAGGGQLVVEDDLVDGGQLVAADVLRPRHGEEPGVVERLVPAGGAGPVVVGRRRRRQPRVVVAQPGAQPATGSRPRRESHRSPRQPPIPRWASTRARLGPAPPNTSLESRARRRCTCARHSHVLPMPPCTWMAVSHTDRAARAP